MNDSHELARVPKRLPKQPSKQLPARVEEKQSPAALALPVSKVGHNELVSAFLRRKNPNTMRAYKRDLTAFADWLEADSIQQAAAALLSADHGRANLVALNYKQHLVECGKAANTINRALTSLRSLVKLGNRLGVVAWELSVDNVSASGYRDTKGPGVSGLKSMLAVLDSRPDKLKTRRDRAMVNLLFGLALRRFEVVAIDYEDVDMPGARLKVTGKGRSQEESLSMSSAVITALKQWIEVRGDAPGPLFTSMDPAGKGSGRLDGNSLYRIVRKIGVECGLSVWPHGLRHTAISTALDATNGNVRKVQKFSRHKDVRTVLVYDDNRKDFGGEVADMVSDSLAEEEEKP